MKRDTTIMTIHLSSRTGRTVIDIIMSGNKTLKKLFIRISIIFIAIVSVGAVFLLLWKDGFFLPRWIIWQNEDFSVILEVSMENGDIYTLTYKPFR